MDKEYIDKYINTSTELNDKIFIFNNTDNTIFLDNFIQNFVNNIKDTDNIFDILENDNNEEKLLNYFLNSKFIIKENINKIKLYIKNYLLQIIKIENKFQDKHNKISFLQNAIENYSTILFICLILFKDITNYKLFDLINIVHMYTDDYIDSGINLSEFISNFFTNKKSVPDNLIEERLEYIFNKIIKIDIKNKKNFIKDALKLNKINNKKSYEIQYNNKIDTNYNILHISLLKSLHTLELYLYCSEKNINQKFKYRISLIIQLIDDFYDIDKDIKNNQQTIFTNIINNGNLLDDEISRLFNFILDTEIDIINNYIINISITNLDTFIKSYRILIYLAFILFTYHNRKYISNDFLQKIISNSIFNIQKYNTNLYQQIIMKLLDI